MLNWHHFLKGLLVTEPQNAQSTPDREAPDTPLEQVAPVEVTEVDGDGEQPPPEWGRQGDGADDPQPEQPKDARDAE